MLRDITYGTFLFYGTMTLIGGIFVFLFVPETKGIPLEDIDILFESKGLAPQQMKAFELYKQNRAIEATQVVEKTEIVDKN